MNAIASSTDDPSKAVRQAGIAQGIVLIFLSCLPTMAIVSLVPNLPQFLERFRSVPRYEILVPMIITLPSLCIAVFSPLAGAIADRFGRRPLLLASTVAYALVGVLPVLLENLYAVLATRFLIGIAEAAILTCQNALMGDYFVGEQRQRWLGLLSIIGPIAAAGLVLAGAFLGSLSWHGPFLLYFIGLPMALWSSFAVFEPQRRAIAIHAPLRTPFPWGRARTVALVTIGVAILYYVQAVQLGRMFSEHGISSTGLIGVYVAIASMGVLCGGLAFTAMAKFTDNTRFVIVFLALAVGYGGIGIASNAHATLLFAWIAQFGNGLAIPTLIGWALQKFAFEHRGRGMGIWGGCFFAGTFVSPLAMTALGAFVGSFLHTVGAVGALCFALAAVIWLAGRLARNGKPDVSGATAP